MTHLPTDAAKRKATPIYSGVMKYFPKALAAVADLSRVGNEQHNPGKPLHWDRSKSTDELDALTRHLVEAGTVDTDGVRHSTKVAWRALANLEKELEAAEAQPKAIGAASIELPTQDLYIPEIGSVVRVVEVSEYDDEPTVSVGDIVTVTQACEAYLPGDSSRYILLNHASVQDPGTYCRVVPAT